MKTILMAAVMAVSAGTACAGSALEQLGAINSPAIEVTAPVPAAPESFLRIKDTLKNQMQWDAFNTALCEALAKAGHTIVESELDPFWSQNRTFGELFTYIEQNTNCATAADAVRGRLMEHSAYKTVEPRIKDILDRHGIFETVLINLVAACIDKKGSRIVLNEGMLTQFSASAELIDYVEENSAFLGGTGMSPIRRTDAEECVGNAYDTLNGLDQAAALDVNNRAHKTVWTTLRAAGQLDTVFSDAGGNKIAGFNIWREENSDRAAGRLADRLDGIFVTVRGARRNTPETRKLLAGLLVTGRDGGKNVRWLADKIAGLYTFWGE